MFEAFLRTTSSEGLQPLGSAPQRSFELVSTEVRNRLGPTHADLFAEPVATPHGDSIDWYAPMQGAAVPLPELAEAEQADLRTRLGQLIGEIKAEAEQLAQSAAPEDQRLGEALANAIEVPDETMIQAVRGEDGTLSPVLIHWAWVRDEQAAVRGVLTGMASRRGGSLSSQAAAAQAQAAAVQQVERRERGRLVGWWLILLGWLLLLALLGLILYLLVAPCGVSGGRLLFCPQPSEKEPAVLSQSGVIEDEIARLQRELALKDRSCKAVIPVTPAAPAPVVPVFPTPTPAPTPTPTPAPETPPTDAPSEEEKAELDQRITKRGAQRGALNFVLEWSTIDDVDLYLTCPNGREISYRNRTDCGGTYDLDANVVRADAITDPAENIVFEQITPGLYKVRAHLRGERTQGPKTLTLHVLRRDGQSQSFTGQVGGGQSEWTTNISISR